MLTEDNYQIHDTNLKGDFMVYNISCEFSMMSEVYSVHVMDKIKIYIYIYIYLRADMTIPKQQASKITFSLFLLFMYFIEL